MTSKWIRCQLSYACTQIDYGYTASAISGPNGPRFLRITDIVSGSIDWNTVPYVIINDELLNKYKLADGDIVIARTGASTGTSAYIKSPPEAIFASYLVRLKTLSDFDARFISYYLKSEWFWSYIHGVLGDKSAQPNASASTMTGAPLYVPEDKNEQRAIAHILGTLDDKIELNRQMNETLENMARALFKSWFVDFDPVRSKVEGRDSGLPKHLAEIFPDRFKDSEWGEIPEGWVIGIFDDDFDVSMGQSPPGETYNETGDGLPFYQGRTDFGFRFPSQRVFCTEPTRLANAGDTLVSVRAPVGDINMAAKRCCIGRGVAAVRHNSSSSSYTYYKLQSIQKIFRGFEAEGTVFGSINKKDFGNIRQVIPDLQIVTAFEGITSSIDKRIECNTNESKSVVDLRDVLLPKLISGELRVKDAERFIKDKGL